MIALWATFRIGTQKKAPKFACYKEAPMRLRALALLAATLALPLYGARSAGADPSTIRVQARSRIRVDKFVREPFGVRIGGRLLDAGNGSGITSRMLEIKVFGVASGDITESAVTNAKGEFEVTVALPLGAYTMSAAFAGDADYGGSELTNKAFDVAKESLTLTISAPATVDVNAKTITVTIKASYDGSKRTVAVKLNRALIDGTGAALDDKLITTVTTDGPDGDASIQLDVPGLGGPGEKRLTATFEGDTAFNGSTAEHTLAVVAPIGLTLAGPTGTVRSDSRIKLLGSVKDHQGPLQVPIAINAAGRRVADVMSDASGNFKVELPASEYRSGKVAFVAEYVSPSRWRRSGKSSPVVIRIEASPPIPIMWAALAALATALLVLGYLLWRWRPWRKVAALARERRQGEEPLSGLKLARAGLVDRFRRPDDHGFSGRVMDAHEKLPVAGAELTLEPPRPVGAPAGAVPAIVLSTGADGSFSLEGLPAGAYSCEVRARGFVRERFKFQLPHRGELRGATVQLLPVREHVLRLYRRVVEPLMPDRAVWGYWTPRELFRHARRLLGEGAYGALGDFTILTEETYYSGRPPGDDVIDRAEALAAQSRG